MKDADRFASVVTAAVQSLETRIEQRLREELTHYVDATRKGVVMRSEPCCDAWLRFDRMYYSNDGSQDNIYAAKRDSFGGMALTFRGEFLNYCPFCGDKL